MKLRLPLLLTRAVMATFRSLATVSVTVACVSAFTASSAFAAVSYNDDKTIIANPAPLESDITLIGSSKTLTLSHAVTNLQSLTFAGSGYGNALTLKSTLTSASVTIGSITFTNSGRIDIASSKTLNITGAFNGANGKSLTITGAGNINFMGTNGFAGDISMNSSGTLSLTNAITANYIEQTSGTVNLSVGSTTSLSNGYTLSGGILNVTGSSTLDATLNVFGGVANITSSTVTGNMSLAGKGGANIISSTVQGNMSLAGTGLADITSSTVTGNMSISGTGLANITSSSIVQGNMSISEMGSANITSSTVTGNMSISGTGLANITSSTVQGNMSISETGLANITSSTVQGNLTVNGTDGATKNLVLKDSIVIGDVSLTGGRATLENIDLKQELTIANTTTMIGADNKVAENITILANGVLTGYHTLSLIGTNNQCINIAGTYDLQHRYTGESLYIAGGGTLKLSEDSKICNLLGNTKSYIEFNNIIGNIGTTANSVIEVNNIGNAAVNFQMDGDLVVNKNGEIKTDSVQDAFTLTTTGSLSGASDLTKSGAGTLTLLRADSTFTGNLLLTGGTLELIADEAMGKLGGTLQLNASGVTLKTGSTTSKSVKISKDIVMLGAGIVANIDIANGSTLDLAGKVDIKGTLQLSGKEDAGRTLQISGNSKGTNINALILGGNAFLNVSGIGNTFGSITFDQGSKVQSSQGHNTFGDLIGTNGEEVLLDQGGDILNGNITLNNTDMDIVDGTLDQGAGESTVLSNGSAVNMTSTTGTLGSVTLTENSTLNVNDSNKVTVTGATTISDTGIVNFDNSAVDMDSLAITNGGSLNAATGTTLTVTGATTISDTGIVNFDNSAVDMDSLAITNGGSLNAATGTKLTVTGATTISDTGIVNFDNSAVDMDSLAVTNGGSLNAATGTTLTVTGATTISDTGIVNLDNSSVDMDSLAITNGGSLNAATGTTLTVTGATTISDTGIVNLDNSAVDMDSLSVTGGGSLNAAAGTTLTVTGATTISDTGVVNLDNSAVDMDSLSVTGGGSLNVATGTTLTVTGATTISDTGSINLDGGSSADIKATLTMNGGDLNIGKTNANTATVTVSNIVADSDSKIIVTAGSSLNVGGGITGNNPAIAMTGDSSFDITGTGKTETNASLSTNGKDINLAGNSTGKVTDALVDMGYTGTMNVTENGSLTLDNTTVLGSVSATGDHANLTLSNVDIKKKPGTGTGQEVGGNLTVTNNANLTLTGTNVAEGKVDITGADLTITNGGTLTTDGDNDIIDVNDGGTINIGGGTGTPGGVTGGTVNSDINVNGGGTVNLNTGAQSTGDILYTGTTGTSLVNVNDDFNLGKDHHVIVNNGGGTNEMAIDANKSFTLDGQMAGDGDLNLTGEGSLVLNADNSQNVTGHGTDHQSHGDIAGGFTGDLNMTGGGTIVLNNNEAMGNEGTLNVTAKDATLKTGATDVSSSKDINVQDVDLNIDTTGDLTLTDLATVTVDGYGAIVKTGAGELTLDSSDVNIEGILQINEGTVNLNNIDANPNLTTGNDIDQIVVNAGTLNITGSVIDGTDITLTDDQSIANLANSTLNLDLKGESGVANINDAAVTINGDIIFEGTTSDDKQMTINVNDNFTFGGNGYDINVNDNGTINVATDKVMILNGNLVGKDTSLDLTKDGNGKLVINTDNTDYEGNIKLTAGSIDVGNDTNALGTGILKVTGDSALNILASTTVGGALVQLNNGITMMGNHTLTLDTANETNLHDSILIGTEGSIVKTGAERLILTNIDGTGMTGTALNVKEGKLLLDNTNMGNKITMSDKTVLEGDQSTVANLKGESGSSIHLGMDKTKDVGHENGYGQLTVTDTMDMTSGSNFYLDIDGASIKSDSIKATHANLKGATVVLNDRGTKGVGKGAWTNEQRYTIVETGDIQSGFDWHVDGLYYLNAHLENTANGVDVVMTQNYKSAAGRTPNQLSIANAVETIENSGKATGALTDMLAAFEHTQSKEEAKQALESVGNIGLTTQMSQQLESNLNHLRLLRSAIGSAMPAVIPSATNMDQKGNLIKPMFDGRNQAWGQATGGTTKLAGDGNGSGYDMNTWGAAIGYERAFTRSFTAGLAFSYENAHIMTKNPYVGNSSYDSDDYYIDLYAKWQKGAWQMNGSLGFSCMDYDMDRSVNVAGGTPAGFNRGATGSTTGMGLNLSYELSYDIVLNKTTMVQPLFTIESSANKIDGYTEGGNIGNAGLVVDDQDAWMTVVGLGGRFIKDFTLLPNAPQARFQFRALMTASIGDQASTVDASFKGAPGTMFRMNGSDPQRLGGLIGADLTVPVSTRTAVFMGSSYEVKGSDHNIMGNVGVRMTF